MISIYTLSCPVTKQVKYVGATKDSLKKRLFIHVNEFSGRRKMDWIYSLIDKRLLPVIELVEECTTEDAKFLEKYWIEQFEAWGFELVNSMLSKKKFADHFNYRNFSKDRRKEIRKLINLQA